MYTKLLLALDVVLWAVLVALVWLEVSWAIPIAITLLVIELFLIRICLVKTQEIMEWTTAFLRN